jgi:1-acyl-sn-glycerol-3-phosphate acyltransferase
MPMSFTSLLPFQSSPEDRNLSGQDVGHLKNSPSLLENVGERPLPTTQSEPSRTDGYGSAICRLYQVFASIVRYHRMAARCDSFHGGQIPLANLKAFISGWAKDALPLLRVEARRVGTIAPLDSPALFVGNHVSYMDIPLLMSQVPVTFLGKAEIAKWPVLGAAGRLAGIVFVKRESDDSRKEASRAIIDCLQTRGMSIGIFPSGTTSLDEGRPWRSGAFRIARMGQVPVQPFRVAYEPLGPAAFLGKDALLPHLFRLLQAGPITARIEFGEPRLVTHPGETARELWEWSRASIPG